MKEETETDGPLLIELFLWHLLRAHIFPMMANAYE